MSSFCIVQRINALLFYRRKCGVTSVLRSKTLAQGEFTSPEHVKSHRAERRIHGAESKKDDM